MVLTLKFFLRKTLLILSKFILYNNTLYIFIFIIIIHFILYQMISDDPNHHITHKISQSRFLKEIEKLNKK
jgi:hypothetical protein